MVFKIIIHKYIYLKFLLTTLKYLELFSNYFLTYKTVVILILFVIFRSIFYNMVIVIMIGQNSYVSLCIFLTLKFKIFLNMFRYFSEDSLLVYTSIIYTL